MGTKIAAGIRNVPSHYQKRSAVVTRRSAPVVAGTPAEICKFSASDGAWSVPSRDSEATDFRVTSESGEAEAIPGLLVQKCKLNISL